jgi:hypothetical protein
MARILQVCSQNTVGIHTMLKPGLTHVAALLVLVALTTLASWGDQRMVERRTTASAVISLPQQQHLGIDSGILFVFQ